MLKETRTVDSVFIRDSILIRYVADTVVRERWRTCWRERIVIDTVLLRSVDTIFDTKFIERVVEVPKKGSGTGWLVATVLMLAIVGFIALKVWNLLK